MIQKKTMIFLLACVIVPRSAVCSEKNTFMGWALGSCLTRELTWGIKGSGCLSNTSSSLQDAAAAALCTFQAPCQHWVHTKPSAGWCWWAPASLLLCKGLPCSPYSRQELPAMGQRSLPGKIPCLEGAGGEGDARGFALSLSTQVFVV